MMKILILLLFIPGPGDISKINSAKSEAKKAYQRGDYKKAIEQYQLLTDSLGIDEEEVRMNLAHAYFQLNDTTNAQQRYQPLTGSNRAAYRSLANQQLGVLSNRQGKLEEALNYFKNAMKADATNEEARYNYEMVKKKLEEKKKQEEQQKNKDQKKDDKDKKDDNQKDKENKDNKDQKDQKDKKDQKDQKDQKDKEQKEKEQKEKEQKQKEQKEKQEQEKKNEENKDKKDTPPSSEKMKDMKISEEKARMVLEAMKNQEIQYLQQNKRKATKPKGKGKPDW